MPALVCPPSRKRIFSGALREHAARKKQTDAQKSAGAGKRNTFFSGAAAFCAGEIASEKTMAALPYTAETKVFLQKTEEIKAISLRNFF